MDRVKPTLERYERWIEDTMPAPTDNLQNEHWEVINHHIRNLLELNEMYYNALQIQADYHKAHGEPTGVD